MHMENKSALPPGAAYRPDFISPGEEMSYVELLDAGTWSTSLKRRVQHFGYRYDYKAQTVKPDAFLGPLPEWLKALGNRLVEHGYFWQLPDQVIANGYLPGQGISAHVDCVPCFGDAIVSVSLLSQCEMVFRYLGHFSPKQNHRSEKCFNGSKQVEALSRFKVTAKRPGDRTKLSAQLQPRSAVILKDAARFDWTHEIPARKSDLFCGERVPRGRRISLTFRTVLPAS